MNEKRTIYDTLTAAYRFSPLLYDNLGIPINRERALWEYCADYNGSPKIYGVSEDGCLVTGDTLKENYKYPDKLTSDEQVRALMLYALRWIKQNWNSELGENHEEM